MLYDFCCPGCGYIEEVSVGMNEIKGIEISCECGLSMDRVYNSPMIINDLAEYYDLQLGETVKSKAHQREIMKERNLVEGAPDPDRVKVSKEASYLAKHGGKEGQKAGKKLKKNFAKKKRLERIRDSLGH